MSKESIASFGRLWGAIKLCFETLFTACHGMTIVYLNSQQMLLKILHKVRPIIFSHGAVAYKAIPFGGTYRQLIVLEERAYKVHCS